MTHISNHLQINRCSLACLAPDLTFALNLLYFARYCQHSVHVAAASCLQLLVIALTFIKWNKLDETKHKPPGLYFLCLVPKKELLLLFYIFVSRSHYVLYYFLTLVSGVHLLRRVVALSELGCPGWHTAGESQWCWSSVKRDAFCCLSAPTGCCVCTICSSMSSYQPEGQQPRPCRSPSAIFSATLAVRIC